MGMQSSAVWSCLVWVWSLQQSGPAWYGSGVFSSLVQSGMDMQPSSVWSCLVWACLLQQAGPVWYGHAVFRAAGLSLLSAGWSCPVWAVFSSLVLPGTGMPSSAGWSCLVWAVFSRLCASRSRHMCWSGRKCPALRCKMVHGPQSTFYNPTVLPHRQRSKIKAAAAPMEQRGKNSCGARPSEDYDLHAERRTMTFMQDSCYFPYPLTA